MILYYINARIIIIIIITSIVTFISKFIVLTQRGSTVHFNYFFQNIKILITNLDDN